MGALGPEAGQGLGVAQVVGPELQDRFAPAARPEFFAPLHAAVEFTRLLSSLMVDSMWLLVMGNPS